MQTTSEFNITELSVRDFKKLLTDIKDKASFEASLLKQVELNSHFWSYLLIYDYILNDGTMELSGKFIEDVLEPEGQTWNNPFRFDSVEVFDEQVSLADLVLNYLEMEFEEVQTERKKRILYIAAFGSYLYFSLKVFSNVEDLESSDFAGYLASNDHTLVTNGEDVFDKHGVGDDWIVTMADEWLMYCGFDSSDYEGECGVHLVNTVFREFSIDYNRMAEDIIAQFV
jgi:hypothetical protein